MSAEHDDRWSARMRGKLMVALPITAIFTLLFLIYAGVQVHTHFEARESLAYWQARLAEEESGEGLERTWDYESPGRRIEGHQKDVDESMKTFFLSLGMGLFFGGLTYFGGRELRRTPR